MYQQLTARLWYIYLQYLSNKKCQSCRSHWCDSTKLRYHDAFCLVSCHAQCFQLYKLWDHFVYAPSQWETMLHCNVVSHRLGAYTKWSLQTIKQTWEKCESNQSLLYLFLWWFIRIFYLQWRNTEALNLKTNNINNLQIPTTFTINHELLKDNLCFLLTIEAKQLFLEVRCLSWIQSGWISHIVQSLAFVNIVLHAILSYTFTMWLRDKTKTRLDSVSNWWHTCLCWT